MRLKHALVLYSLLTIVAPQPPSMYTFILDNIATIVSMWAHGLIMMYLWTRPPMQQTVPQHFSMVIIIAMACFNLKEYAISLMGNCFRTEFQSLLDSHILLACGFFNNRVVYGIIELSAIILSLSKLLLLVKPSLYHGANHTRIVKVCMLICAILFLVDTYIYLSFGNSSYCHSLTTLRFGHIYNMKISELNIELLKSQHLNIISTVLDMIFWVPIAVLEICIICVKIKTGPETLSSLVKTELKTQYHRIFCISRQISSVAPLPMYALNMPHGVAGVGDVEAPPSTEDIPDQSLNLNTKLNQLKFTILNLPEHVPNNVISNKYYVIHSIAIFANLMFVQMSMTISTEGGDHLYIAVMCYITYCRFFKYALPVVWLFYNHNFRHYLGLKLKQCMIKFNRIQ